jgi:hypothetical protein
MTWKILYEQVYTTLEEQPPPRISFELHRPFSNQGRHYGGPTKSKVGGMSTARNDEFLPSSAVSDHFCSIAISLSLDSVVREGPVAFVDRGASITQARHTTRHRVRSFQVASESTRKAPLLDWNSFHVCKVSQERSTQIATSAGSWDPIEESAANSWELVAGALSRLGRRQDGLLELTAFTFGRRTEAQTQDARSWPDGPVSRVLTNCVCAWWASGR